MAIELRPRPTSVLPPPTPKKVRTPSKPKSQSLSQSQTTTTAPKDLDPDAMHHEYEFGGPVGTLAMMICFPALFYYLYACLFFFDGNLARPDRIFVLLGEGGWIPFVKELGSLIYTNAFPTRKAFILYTSLILLQFVLALTMPGVTQRGLPVSSLGGATLSYHCNAYVSLYATITIVASLHFSGIFNLGDIIDLYGPLLSVASLSGFGLAAVIYGAEVWGTKEGGYRMSGNVVYDYFMGACLNPRVLGVDVKMWAEIRISWILLWALAMGAVVKQWQEYGFVSPNVVLFAYGTGLYLNACAKGEEFIPQTWDINYEKFGWLLSYWNFAGVPFSYAYPAIYMATHDPASYRYPNWFICVLFVVLTTSYCLFDLAMGQKSWFKASQTGTYIPRSTFPQIPGTRINNPKVLVTKTGSKLLISGCWGFLRKPNYTADWIQGLCWALSAGIASPIPFFYPAFHLTMLLHRNGRDNLRCARKYGEDWKKYQEIVPYTFIPYVY